MTKIELYTARHGADAILIVDGTVVCWVSSLSTWARTFEQDARDLLSGARSLPAHLCNTGDELDADPDAEPELVATAVKGQATKLQPEYDPNAQDFLLTAAGRYYFGE